MIELFEKNELMQYRKSSKGNQLKWMNNNIWYKADYCGYEGLVEYVISKLLIKTSLKDKEYVLYDTEEIRYKKQIYLGCASLNFLPEGYQIITLERLFENYFGVGLNKSIYAISENEDRLKFLVQQVERITGLSDFGKYMSKLLTIDALFLNEDRHTHNIAVLLDDKGIYHYCPIFDNGAALLSDTTMDYPLSENSYELIKCVKSKTFTQSFDEQLDVVEALYGQNIFLYFTKKDVEDILEEEKLYSSTIKNRVKEILYYQMDKYQYLFREKDYEK